MYTDIDCLARALYAAEHEDLDWNCAPEIVQEEFRHYARTALAMLARHRKERSEADACVFPYAA
jgi:hypothetical protein